MICPKCRSEYRPGFETCAECNRKLVDSLPEAATEPDHELLAVLRTTDPALLPVAVSVLEAAGIPHIVQGAAGVSVFPLGPAAARATNRATGASILVSSDRYDEARALLETPPEPLD
jgi:hypothetical protein